MADMAMRDQEIVYARRYEIPRQEDILVNRHSNFIYSNDKVNIYRNAKAILIKI